MLKDEWERVKAEAKDGDLSELTRKRANIAPRSSA